MSHSPLASDQEISATILLGGEDLNDPSNVKLQVYSPKRVGLHVVVEIHRSVDHHCKIK